MGLPHIIEHSVLCGSKKYPLKDAFAELLRSSLQTFLNAMTFSDKTVYPFSSRNKKDYFNLMDVYLDSVLFPLLTTDTFKQEGWHYELEDKNSIPVYKGVVYNEMRGAYSSPLSVLERNIETSLFPDTPYGKDSGGDPDKIPDLTYNEFRDFHSRYYHPSNSYIYFYGDAKLEEELKWVHFNFLRNFTYCKVDSNIQLQKPFKKIKELEYSYPVARGESTKDKSFLCLASVIGDNHNRELQLAFHILEHILLRTPASPLKNKLLKANISQDVKGEHSDYIIQPYFYVTLLNTETEHKKEFLNIYNETLENLVKNGIDKKLINAAFNSVEFELGQIGSDTMRGLHYFILSLNTWLYGDSPLSALKYEDNLRTLKKKAESGFLEELLQRYLLKNPHQAIISVKPDLELAEKITKEQRGKLLYIKSKMSDNDIQSLIKDTIRLKKEQSLKEKKENVDRLPKLSLSDIPDKLEKIPRKIRKINGITMLTHNIFTQKILYLDLIFDMSWLPDRYIPYLNLFGNSITKMGTKEKDYIEFAKEVATYTGKLEVTQRLINHKDNYHRYSPLLFIHGEALPQNFRKMRNIYIDVIKNMVFSDEKRLYELVMMEKSRIENMIQEQGIKFVDIRLQSYESDEGKFREQMDGISQYYFIRDLLNNFTEKKNEIIKSLEEMRDILFNKENLLINLTGDEESLKPAIPVLDKLLDVINNKKFKKIERNLPHMTPNQGLKMASKVQYTGIGGNLFSLGMPYNGAALVCNNLLHALYLWNNIRLMGGAYGCMNQFDDLGGHYYIISYRDPNLTNTYRVYQGIPKMLENLALPPEEFDKIIISTIGKIDKPLNPYDKGLRSLIDFISGRTYEDRVRVRKEVINTKPDDLKKLAPYFKKLAANGYRCTLGNEKKIEEEGEWFNEKLSVL
jgi:hypothetical protein